MDRVAHRDRTDPVTLAGHRFPDRDDVEGEDRILLGGDHPEVGPDAVVEHVLVHRLHRLAGAVDDDGLLPLADEEVGHERHVLHVIEVAVGQEDVVDPQDLVQLERGGDRPRIDAERLVEQETGRLVSGQLAAMTAENADFHVAVSSDTIFPRPVRAKEYHNRFRSTSILDRCSRAGKGPTSRALSLHLATRRARLEGRRTSA